MITKFSTSLIEYFSFFLAYEERLHMQSIDFERERKNLQELISRLEVHLSEQTKLVEEVKIQNIEIHLFSFSFF